MLPHQLLHQQEVASRIFFLSKHRCHQLAGGIIDGRKPHEPGASVTQPGMSTAIDLDQHALLDITRASASMLPSVLFSGGTHPSCLQDATHTRAGEPDAIAFGQQIAQMLVIASPIRRACSADHLASYLPDFCDGWVACLDCHGLVEPRPPFDTLPGVAALVVLTGQAPLLLLRR